jgi:hypothetical protein
MTDFNTNIHDAAYEAAADFLGDYNRGTYPSDEIAAVELVAHILTAITTAAERYASTFEWPEVAS